MSEWLPGTKVGSSFEQCYEVSACTNEKREKAVVFDVATAAEQGRVYMRAGHREFSVEPVWLLIDGEGQYVCQDNGGMTIGTVRQEVIPSRYLRAVLYPCITVYEYDRDVLKRRISFTQFVTMCIAPAILVMSLGVAVGGLVEKTVSRDVGAIAAAVFPVGFLITMLVAPESAIIRKAVAFGEWVAGILEGESW